ncbi:MAG: hypothetical protein WCG92_20845, partial [Hyphomicrobiales bacterium]
IRTVTLFTPPVQAGADGVASIPIDMPDFNGEVRLMAVAWQGSKIGAASKPMTVPDPLIAGGVTADLRLAIVERFASLGKPGLRTNAEADGALLEEIARHDPPGLSLLREAADAMKLSARGYHRVLRVARTLADLERQEQVARIHIAEALSYRQKLSAFVAVA